ncbi:MAG: rod shape-determining protein MreC [bacterium]
MIKRIISKPIIVSLIIITVLILVNSFGLLNYSKKIFFKITNPLQEKVYQLSWRTNKLVSFWISIKNLKDKNEQLIEENQYLLGEMARLNNIYYENVFLREQLKLSEENKDDLVLTDVIGQNLSASGKYILINKGRLDGIKQKQMVIISGNILIGQIIEVEESVSKVKLVTDINSRVNAVIQDSDIDGLVQGGQNDLIMDLIPQGKEIIIGDTVVTSGLAGVFKRGLFIGRVQKIISTDVDVFQKVVIVNNIDWNSISRVFVIRN